MHSTRGGRAEGEDAVDFDRPARAYEHILDEEGVQVAHHVADALDQRLERARCQIDRHLLFVEFRLEPDVVEMLVDGVELMMRALVEVDGGRNDASQEVAAFDRIIDPPLRTFVRDVAANRPEELPGAATMMIVLHLRADEALIFENPNVVSQSVLVETCLLRKLRKTDSGGLIKGMQYAHTTRLG